MEWMLMPLKRYADFQGRSRRKEYWMFTLFIFLVYIGIGILATILSSISETLGLIAVLFYVVFAIGIIVPSIAVAIRRMHDQDKSGWFILIPIYSFILTLLDGTPGPNRFGPDPKGQADPAAFE